MLLFICLLRLGLNMYPWVAGAGYMDHAVLEFTDPGLSAAQPLLSCSLLLSAGFKGVSHHEQLVLLFILKHEPIFFIE